MDTTTFLQWQYLIFVLPAGIAALFLLLSSLHLGHHTGHGLRLHGHAPVHGAHGVAGGHGHAAPAAHSHGVARAPQAGHGHQHAAPAARTGTAQNHNQTAKDGTQQSDRPNVSVTTNFVLQLSGADRAPLIMIVELFCLVWGIGGYLANLTLLHTATPTLRQILPSLSVALLAGLIGARIGAEVLARIMPKEESLDVSRDGLFGLTGSVAFPISDTAGRIHIYDRFGTLHDETCRVPQGHPGIARGRRAMVVDVDHHGTLVVEEVPDTVQ